MQPTQTQTRISALELAKLMLEAMAPYGVDRCATATATDEGYWVAEATAANGRTVRIRSTPNTINPQLWGNTLYCVEYQHGTGWMQYGRYSGPHTALMALVHEVL